jgi:hypothetical protein
MTSRAFQLSLLIAAFASCAPHVTIVEEASGGGSGGGGAQGMGGTDPTGGTLGTSASGGTGSTAPQAGAMGFAGGGGINPPESCAQPLDQFLPASCDAQAAIQSYCSKGGCHGSTKAGGLDLRINEFFVARILNVRVTFRHTEGFGDTAISCVPEGCPTDALLLDQNAPEESWILRKMEPYVPPQSGTTNTDIGCGDWMPSLLSAGIASYSQEDKDCLTQFFLDIARFGRPCPELVAQVPDRAPPCEGPAGNAAH